MQDDDTFNNPADEEETEEEADLDELGDDALPIADASLDELVDEELSADEEEDEDEDGIDLEDFD
jgi:hypothetical protein